MVMRDRVSLAMTLVSALGTFALSMNMAGSPYPSVRKDATIALVLSAILIVALLGILIHALIKGRRTPAA